MCNELVRNDGAGHGVGDLAKKSPEEVFADAAGDVEHVVGQQFQVRIFSLQNFVEVDGDTVG